jgi:hypothetical protein
MVRTRFPYVLATSALLVWSSFSCIAQDLTGLVKVSYGTYPNGGSISIFENTGSVGIVALHYTYSCGGRQLAGYFDGQLNLKLEMVRPGGVHRTSMPQGGCQGGPDALVLADGNAYGDAGALAVLQSNRVFAANEISELFRRGLSTAGAGQGDALDRGQARSLLTTRDNELQHPANSAEQGEFLVRSMVVHEIIRRLDQADVDEASGQPAMTKQSLNSLLRVWSSRLNSEK